MPFTLSVYSETVQWSRLSNSCWPIWPSLTKHICMCCPSSHFSPTYSNHLQFHKLFWYFASSRIGYKYMSLTQLITSIQPILWKYFCKAPCHVVTLLVSDVSEVIKNQSYGGSGGSVLPHRSVSFLWPCSSPPDADSTLHSRSQICPLNLFSPS